MNPSCHIYSLSSLEVVLQSYRSGVKSPGDSQEYLGIGSHVSLVVPTSKTDPKG